MPVFRGRVTLAQESRFQVTDEAGVSELFLLSPHASAEPDQLRPLAARQAKVRVKFTRGHNIMAHSARRIDVQDEETSR